MARSSLPWAVIRMTGVSGYLARTASTSSRPSICGMSMSVRTTSGETRGISSRASTPLPAKTGFQPSAFWMMAPASRRSMAESSTTRTVW